MKTIKIDQDIYNHLKSKASNPEESLALTLRRELGLQRTETIEVDDDTFEYLLSKTTNFGESVSDILRRELDLDHPHNDPTAVIVFHIPAGTGTQPWNTLASAVVATVGDTLRIVNDDSVPHRLHTTGIPFPHPSSNILPAQAAEYLLESPFGNGAALALYDHVAGPGAQFWIQVRPLD